MGFVFLWILFLMMSFHSRSGLCAVSLEDFLFITMLHCLSTDTWITSPLPLLCCWEHICKYLMKVLFPVSLLNYKTVNKFLRNFHTFSIVVSTFLILLSIVHKHYFSSASLALCRVFCLFCFFVSFWRGGRTFVLCGGHSNKYIEEIVFGLWMVSKHDATYNKTKQNVRAQRKL